MCQWHTSVPSAVNHQSTGKTVDTDDLQQPQAPVPTAHAAAFAGVAVSPKLLAVLASLAILVLIIKKVLDTPSRAYNENVGDEYDAWTQEGILEYYWGEHIHLGYYTGGPDLHRAEVAQAQAPPVSI